MVNKKWAIFQAKYNTFKIDLIWCFVTKTLPIAQVQFMVFPLDVILRHIRNTPTFRKQLPQTPIGILVVPTFPWIMSSTNFAEVPDGFSNSAWIAQ